MILKAKEFAIEAHVGGTYSGYPYSKHLNDVYNILISFGIFNEIVLSGGWLHDAIEDTRTVYEDILNEFGREIADISYLLTDKPGKNRKERHQNTYPELAKNHYARLIKIADRLANVMFSTHGNQEKFAMYDKEYPYFKQTLQSGMRFEDEFHDIELTMWERLDKIIEVGPFID